MTTVPLKTISYAGSPMRVGLLKRAIRFFGENLFVQFLGMTETGPTITHLPRKDHVFQGTERQLKGLHSVGGESQHVHVRIVDNEGRDLPPYQVGEIIALCKKNLASYKKPTSVELVCRRFLILSSPEK